jgi:hypothetical protein
MTTVCCICDEVISTDGAPEPVSHGMHELCAQAFYGEDYEDILAGEPT